MTEQTPPSTLAERALTRLRQLASGNGLEPAAISILEPQEDIFNLSGKMEISPLCETEPASYPGGVKGKGKRLVASVNGLKEAVARHKAEFTQNPDWIPAAVQEIKAHHSQGWGLEDAKVTLADKSITFAATENCPSCGGRQTLTCTQCNGQGTVICNQCQGKGREPCYYCNGRGEDPQHPGQSCATCNGTRLAPCRFCQSRGYLSCPTCQGRRGTTCTTCQGSGRITHEVTVSCGAETHFTLKAEGLPSGLRRGLDRIGIANIGKGHADISASPPSEEEVEAAEGKSRIPVLTYHVKIPYAELRVGFVSKKAVISVVGKRCVIMGVPPFLDTALQPWRNKLRQAASGKGPISDALEVRALKEILSLTVAGKGYIENVRKTYPYGLSAEAIKEILQDMQLALNQTTLKTRTLIAGLCVGLCAAFFYVFFVTGLDASLSKGWSRPVTFLIDDIALGSALAASWATLNFSTRFVLKKRFPQLRLALQQKIGKTGYSMLGGIILAFILCIWLAPIKPTWLSSFTG